MKTGTKTKNRTSQWCT